MYILIFYLNKLSIFLTIIIENSRFHYKLLHNCLIMRYILEAITNVNLMTIIFDISLISVRVYK
jgi:hypothetical protein